MANPSPSTDALQELHRRVASMPEALRPAQDWWEIMCRPAEDGWWVAAAFFHNGKPVVDGSGESISVRYRPIIGDRVETPKPPYRSPHPRLPMAGAGGEGKEGGGRARTGRRPVPVGEDAA